MKIFLDASRKKIELVSEELDFEMWQLNTPLSRRAYAGVPWALDNGCFANFRRETWLEMLYHIRISEVERPMFVCLPDIVGDARRTLELYSLYLEATNGFRRALVLQDGIGAFNVPWHKVDAVFVGGSDEFKISKECMSAAKTAKYLGKWVHVGRVNTAERVRYWLGIADSIDGSGISKYDHMLRDVVFAIKGSSNQLEMFREEESPCE